MKSKPLILSCTPLAFALLLGACATRTASIPAPAVTELPAAALAPLPEPVTSFAAVTHDGWLYVSGGHMGERHDYNADKVSGSFHRLRLSDGTNWEALPPTIPAQGLALVAQSRHLYRIGGMAARNAAGAKQDLHSLADVLRYDVQRGRWEPFVALPEPRSSHDAAVLGDRLFVFGGWQMTGGTNQPVWPDYGLMLNLKNPGAGWRKIAQPFRRRALAVAVLDERLFCLGGMDSDNKPTLAVEVYDPADGKWSTGPELPAGKFKGFSCSAITQAGRLYANTFQGNLLRLAPDARSWEIVGRLQHPRLAHRLVTAGTTQLIALGGEDGDVKRPELELLSPASAPLVPPKASSLSANR